MNLVDRDVASLLLAMPPAEFHGFIRQAVRDRKLHVVVQSLNELALSKADPKAVSARKALKRIGF